MFQNCARRNRQRCDVKRWAAITISVIVLLTIVGYASAMFVFRKDSHSQTPTNLKGLLYPRESESREVKSLDGLWDFAVSPPEDDRMGHRELWYSEELGKKTKVMQMPVPSSYNDVTTSGALRDHVGTAWYDRSFFVPRSWSEERVFVRFGSVNYLAEVWINGDLVLTHEGGHLPFEAEITNTLSFGKKNRITVAVDNSLLPTSIPQGEIHETATDNGTARIQSYSFDFFNYAGIHRPVLLHTKPRLYIADIDLIIQVTGTTARIEYTVEALGNKRDEFPKCRVVLRQDDNGLAFDGNKAGFSGTITVPEAKLWWPIGMNDKPAYMYTLEVTVFSDKTTKPDIYRLPVGIRQITWTNQKVLVNGKPVYLRGFGRHEDSIIRGRGLDLVTMTRDYELLKWVGANSYRTSHYPYSDEVLDMADRQGILIISECPAVNIESTSSEILAKHKLLISETIRKDRHHPSVFMWSIANEPRSNIAGGTDYWKQIRTHTKLLDKSRPITAALAVDYTADKAATQLDVIGFNRYNAWYSNAGRLDIISTKIVEEAVAWNAKHNKPVMILEYGADTMPGMHELPSYIWSEEYQQELFSKHFIAFDQLRRRKFFIGEFVWNFADFRTAQGYTRVGGNKKGIFTRERQPKLVAHHVRNRYHALREELDNIKPPTDLHMYTAGPGQVFFQKGL